MEAPRLHKSKHKSSSRIINRPQENGIEEEKSDNLENGVSDVNTNNGENIPDVDGAGGGGSVDAGGGTAAAAATFGSGDDVKKHKNKKQELRQRESILSDDVEAGNVEKMQKGILGYMDRQMKPYKKPQSLSDPQGSPVQRSSRSRSSTDKSPRRKRSKSESRRRRERKMIAAGEMEVRQANETLMRYLKQCTEINDASLSGELEIDKNLEDRRVYRKTKAQRNRRSHLITSKLNGKLPQSDLSAVLNDLTDDILPHNGEIYNPFTPVVSPTEGPPTRIDKMYIQTPKGYRSVDNTFYKTHITHDLESEQDTIQTGVQLSCAIQRVWIHISNICHGLLGGLAMAHLLLIFSTKPYDWVEGSIRHYSAFAQIYANTFYCLAVICMVSVFDRMDLSHVHISVSSSDSIQFRWIIISMIYVATIILSLSAESMDERLYLSTSNITIWEDEMESNRVLSIWNTLSIARSIGAIFGWVLIGLSPSEDLLYDHLVELEKYQLTNNN